MGCCLTFQLCLLILLLREVHSSSSSFSSNSTSHLQLCPHHQTLALLHFKNIFSFNRSASDLDPYDLCGNKSYPKMQSWEEGTDCCSWDGVTCNRMTGHVIGLDLSCSQLYGTLHSNSTLFLLDLPHLQTLNLALNDFRNSQISPHFGRFPRLKHLNLANSQFSGNIPSEIMYLSKLISLDLSCIYSDGLRLNAPNLKGLVQNLTELRQLSLDRVDMSMVQLGSLRNLSSSLANLSLQECDLRGKFPNDIFGLPNLRKILLASNSDLIGYLPKHNWSSSLEILDLVYTSFLGEVPDSIGNLQSLNYLDLWSCNFSGSIPASLGNLTQIKLLSLDYNHFTGEIPSSLSNLSQLVGLGLSSFYLNAHFPSFIFNLTLLVLLTLSECQLMGPIPFLPLPNLKFLILSDNLLQGEIPSSIFSVMRSLEILDLSNNSFSGVIPECLGNFSNSLTVLDLRMNGFHGSIPRTFKKGNRLRNIALNGNQLEGPVPRSLINCRNLELLDLGNNKINDTFPYWLETLPELRVFVLRSNRFHDSISSSKAKHPFPKLRIFDLSNNDFNGPLPVRYFKNLKAMMNVNEVGTKLNYMGEFYYHDSVILTIKGLELKFVRIITTLTAIDLSNNNFQGEIPKSIGKLHSLRVLNFSHNHLMGHIPTMLENLGVLESLDLSSNNLTGEIPSQLRSLTFLAFLNLSQNHLMGRIPQGNQFNTFQNDSYFGNWGLCGVPLSKECNYDEASSPPQMVVQEEEDLVFTSGFGWKVVFMGYGCGMIFGMVMGYLMFLTGKPKWLVRIIEEEILEVVRWRNRNARRRGRRRIYQIQAAFLGTGIKAHG